MPTSINPASRQLVRTFFEPLVWLAALVFLFFINPTRPSFSLCVFKLLGFAGCPGCGIGHAIHYALHLSFRQSVQAHALGIPATLGIGYTLPSSLHSSFQTHFTWTRTNYS